MSPAETSARKVRSRRSRLLGLARSAAPKKAAAASLSRRLAASRPARKPPVVDTPMEDAKTLAGRLSARAGAAARLAARRLVARATRREEVLVTGRTSPGAWGRAAAVSDRT